MKIHIFCSLIALVCLVGEPLFAEENKYELYAMATEAYQKGDCDNAVKLFRQFALENEDALKPYPEFLNGINTAIRSCSDYMRKKERVDTIRAYLPPIHGETK